MEIGMHATALVYAVGLARNNGGAEGGHAICEVFDGETDSLDDYVSAVFHRKVRILQNPAKNGDVFRIFSSPANLARRPERPRAAGLNQPVVISVG